MLQEKVAGNEFDTAVAYGESLDLLSVVAKLQKHLQQNEAWAV